MAGAVGDKHAHLEKSPVYPRGGSPDPPRNDKSNKRSGLGNPPREDMVSPIKCSVPVIPLSLLHVFLPPSEQNGPRIVAA